MPPTSKPRRSWRSRWATRPTCRTSSCWCPTCRRTVRRASCAIFSKRVWSWRGCIATTGWCSRSRFLKYFISIFQTKYLTRPLQATCITAVCVQLIGALGYIGLWNDANYSQFMVLITTHYNSLIALSLVQGLLFFNWWANGYTGHIDKFRIFRRDYYNNRVLTPEPIKID